MNIARIFVFSKNIKKIYNINNIINNSDKILNTINDTNNIISKTNETINILNTTNKKDFTLNIKRFYLTTSKKENQSEQLIKKLDEYIKEANTDNEKHQSILDIANEFLKKQNTIYENSLFLSKICKYNKLNQEYWNDYINKFNKLVTSSSLKSKIKEFGEGKDMDYKELHVLTNISKSLITAKLVSKPLGSIFMKVIIEGVFNLIPYKLDLFNSMLDYLVHCDYKEKFTEDVFDMVSDFAHVIKPSELIHVIYCFGRLGQRNDEMIQTVARILHNNISKGLLTPYEKTKLAKAYSLLNYEHITFFNHITQELMVMFNKMDSGNWFKNEVKEKDDNKDNKNIEDDKDNNKENTTINNNNNKVYNYTVGIGSTNCKPSGVMVNVLKYIHLYNVDLDGEDINSNSSNNTINKEPETVEFRGDEEQIYTCGQIIMILDSMIYLRIHHLEPEFKKLVNYGIKHLFKTDVVKYFDSEQLRCCVTLLATCRKSVDEQLLEFITKRFVNYYLDGNATNTQLSIFLKDLVKLTKVVVKSRNIRNKLLYNSNFIPPKWINNPLDDNPNLMDPKSSRSIIEHICYKICNDVNTSNMNDLSSCLRSIAYLGYRNEKFYSVFIPHIRQNMESMNNDTLSNITQSFNKAGIKDKYFFYLLGKQHQLYLHELEDKRTMKRIG